MKIRTGFVSNSSSSSFIVKLSKPISEYSLKEFIKEYKINEMYEKFANKLFTDLHYDKIVVDTWDLDFSIYSDRIEAILGEDKLSKIKTDVIDYAKRLIEKHICDKENEYIVHYADDDGAFFSKMEHEFMPNLSCTIKRISHH